jgi:hypothetical protein
MVDSKGPPIYISTFIYPDKHLPNALLAFAAADHLLSSQEWERTPRLRQGSSMEGTNVQGLKLPFLDSITTWRSLSGLAQKTAKRFALRLLLFDHRSSQQERKWQRNSSIVTEHLDHTSGKDCEEDVHGSFFLQDNRPEVSNIPLTCIQSEWDFNNLQPRRTPKTSSLEYLLS